MTIAIRARERLKKLKQQVGKTESEKAAKEQELRKRATVFRIINIYKYFKHVISFTSLLTFFAMSLEKFFNTNVLS